jgi:hypothetical protein
MHQVAVDACSTTLSVRLLLLLVTVYQTRWHDRVCVPIDPAMEPAFTSPWSGAIRGILLHGTGAKWESYQTLNPSARLSRRCMHAQRSTLALLPD